MYPIADAHCDYLYGAVNRNYDFDSPRGGQAIALPYMKEGNVRLQLYAVWVDSKIKKPYLHQCMEMVDAYHDMLAKHEELCVFDRDYVPESGKYATVLTVEGGEAIEGNIANLRVLHRLGVRAMALTWNYTNELAQPAMRKHAKGLTAFGRDVVREMCRLNMAIDTAHLSDRGIDDILELTDAPIFASHSNSRSVFEHPRSLTDEHIKEIASRGGVIGINFFHLQLTKRPTACIDDIIRQIERVAEVGGIRAVCIGSDFDGMGSYPEGLSNSSMLQKLPKRLEKLGYTEEQIAGIAYGNLADYMRRFV